MQHKVTAVSLGQKPGIVWLDYFLKVSMGLNQGIGQECGSLEFKFLFQTYCF